MEVSCKVLLSIECAWDVVAEFGGKVMIIWEAWSDGGSGVARFQGQVCSKEVDCRVLVLVEHWDVLERVTGVAIKGGMVEGGCEV